jgi:hypothetical protein
MRLHQQRDPHATFIRLVEPDPASIHSTEDALLTDQPPCVDAILTFIASSTLIATIQPLWRPEDRGPMHVADGPICVGGSDGKALANPTN